MIPSSVAFSVCAASLGVSAYLWLSREQAVRAAQRHHAASTNLLHEVFDLLPLGVVLHHKGTLRYLNRSLRETLAVGDAPITGRRLFDFIHPDDHAMIAERIRRFSEAPQAFAPVDFRAIDLRGHTLWLESLPMRQLEVNGETCHLVAVRDVTEHRKLAERLQLTDRMVSLGTLAAGVVHELNNPLAWLNGNLELAAEHARQPGFAAIRDLLDECLSGADRLRAIIADLKTFSRREESAPEPLDVRPLVDATTRLAANEIRRRATLIVEHGEIPSVEANAARLGQVLLNLVLNAAQAIPPNAAESHRIHVQTGVDPEGWVRIAIRDTGIGMTPEVRKQVFDPFFTTKPVGEGTGLGLPVCHGIISGLGGEILVESEPGNGSTFTVRLPPTRARPRTPSPPPPRTREPSRRKILVIDDEPAMVETLMAALRHHEVECAESGEVALDYCRRQTFDVIVCDLMMPGVTGMDFYETLEAMGSPMARRILFLTGGAFTARAQAFLDANPNPCLEKPFRLAVLREAVDGMIDGISPG